MEYAFLEFRGFYGLLFITSATYRKKPLKPSFNMYLMLGIKIYIK